MAQIFPIDFDEKLTIAQDDFILFSDSEDWNKIKKAQYSNLKWEKWDTGATWPQWPQWETWPQWPQGIQGIQGIQWETWPKWETWETWATWARIDSAAFSGNDIVFWETDWNTVTLENAKTILTWPQGEQWEQGIQWPQGEAWPKGDTWSKGDKWDKGDTGTAATISVGTTTTWEPWTDASVVNSWTSSAAVLDFTIPKGAKWDTGATGATWAKINSANFSWDDMVFWLTDSSTVTLAWAKTTLTWPQWEQWPQWIQGIQGIQWPQWEQWIQGETWETWPQWPTGATGNGISSITSSKSWKTTTVTITETSWNVDTFQIQDWQDWEWAWDVLWPSSSVNGNVVLFDWTTGKLIKDSWKTLPSVIDNLTSTSTTDALSANQWKVLNTSISTINSKIPSEATSSNKLADKNYVDDSINSVTAYYITKNAAWAQFATYAELDAATTFYSWWVVRVPTRNDYCIVLDDENYDHATTRYIYNTNWEYQYTVNETALTQAQMDALNSGITSTKVGNYDTALTTIWWYWDIVTYDASDFYSSSNPSWYTSNVGTITWIKMNGASKWTSWVVDLWTVITEHQALKTINSTSLVWTWNISVQPTLESWTNIKTVNNTSLLGSWNVAVQPTLVSWTNIKTVWWVSVLWSWDVSVWVTSVNWNSWAVTVNAYAPWNTWSTWQVLTKTADGYEYQNAPVTSVNGSTWAITWLQITANLKTDLTDNSDSYYPSQKAVKTAVDGKQATLVSWTNIKTINNQSILGSGNLTVSWLPSWWQNWQIIMMVNWTPTWVTPTAKWFKMLSPNSPLNVPYDWYGTESQYSSATKSNDTEYRTY